MHASMHLVAAVAALAGLTGGALPQGHAGQEGHEQAAGTASAYSGLEARPIKGLSAQQIGDLRAGRGMGLALPAELNDYPGPVHVLEQAVPLGLSDPQRSSIQKALNAMKAETIPLGERIIAAEVDLDRLFRDRTVTPASLNAATAHIGRLQGELRAAHLSYHLATVEVLSPEQIRRYSTLRGYDGESPASPIMHPTSP